MKEKYITKSFHPKSKALLRHIEAIMAHYDAKGLDLTVRQLYYQLVSKDIIPNSNASYRSTVDLVSNARYAGLLDWDIIKDRNRRARRSSNWPTVREFLDDVKGDFAIDKWEDQSHYIEVMVEKDALSGIIAPVCFDLDLTFTANKGFASASSFYLAGKRLRRQAELGKTLHVFYLGDHDPSGCFMTDDVITRLRLLGGDPINLDDDRPFVDELPMNIHRLGLNMDQIRKFKPPINPAKMTDPRAKAYVKKYGKKSWELDALEPETLVEVITSAAKKLRDEDLWQKALKREADLKSKLEKIVKRCKA